MILWRSLDPPGHEACWLVGETLEGTAVLVEPPSTLSYRVVCDASWRTKSATVTGFIESRTIDIHIAVEDGHWSLNGVPQLQLEGCVDVDLNFTPATNTLPIRRLRDGGTISVAWLRFPSMTLERLEQTYRRLGERTWEYSSEDFRAQVEVDEEGLVTNYEGLWVRA